MTDPNQSRATAAAAEAVMQVRASDIEPYIALRYLSKLFRFMAAFVLVLLVAEVILGLTAQGTAALGRLLIEMTQFVVFAGLLWGAGDLATLLIDVGHDIRATRILIGRQAAHHLLDHHEGRPGGDGLEGRRSGEARPIGRDAGHRS
jgi:hypothetical protein